MLTTGRRGAYLGRVDHAVNQFADALREYREQQGLSRGKFGLIPEHTLMDLELGKTRPSLPTLRLVFELLGWTCADVGALVMSLPDEPRFFYVPGPG